MKYKFRGKWTLKDEWVYGSFVQTEDESRIITRHQQVLDFNFVVHPETVGMFTGFTDTNDKEIYEGDRVKCFDYGRSDWYQGVIVFDDGAFCVQIEKCLTDEIDLRDGQAVMWSNEQTPPMYEFERFEVIGNITEKG